MSAAALQPSTPAPPGDDADGRDLSAAVIDGRARVVARFDLGARRYFVLACAPVGAKEPTAGRWRREALPRLARGMANKAIALDLELAESTVSRALGAWCRALDVTSPAELAQLARALEGAVRVSPASGGLVVSVDLDGAWSAAGLTSAEAAIAALAVRGLTNAEIAARRGTSVATVVNQLRAVHRKLGTSGRVGLSGAPSGA
ncbi:MAG: LuxR C-terminal-related transcriptional regulator [Sandaracinus sp.]